MAHEVLTGITPIGRELWRARVDATPDAPFLLFDDDAWTYAEFDHRVARVAGGLRERGVEPGTRVLVGMDNRPETLAVHLALQQLGAVCVPLVMSLAERDLRFQAEHSGARLLIADEPVASHLPDAVRADDLPAADPLSWEPVDGYDERSPFTILYTSGSSGRPKGVLLGAGSFFSGGLAFNDRFGTTAEDNYILPLTLAHALGAVSALSMVLHAGCRMTLLESFSPKRFWHEVARHQATISILFPAQLNLLLEVADEAQAPRRSSMRLVITHADLPAVRARFGTEIATVWGMTETGTLCTGSEPGEHRREDLVPEYIGTPMLEVEAGIFDDSGRELGPGETGELRLRHPHVMLGYLDDPDATTATLVDGWVRSGDAGRRDADGRVYFGGRIKNVIKRGGENISAEDVEQAIAEHTNVVECLVFAVPDRLRTEEVGAIVVTRDATLTAETLRDFLAERLTAWKLPRFIWLHHEPLPRLGNGKIDRRRATTDAEPGAAADLRPHHSR